MSGLAAGIGVSIDRRITLDINQRANKSDLCQRLSSPPQRLQAYPFCRFSKRSLRGPSMTKSVTRNQLVWRLPLLPLLLATAYLMYSFGFSSVPAVWGSGVSAKWPTMVMRATERGAVVLKARAAPAVAQVAQRNRKDDMVGYAAIIDNC